jgi:hypothetical protein
MMGVFTEVWRLHRLARRTYIGVNLMVKPVIPSRNQHNLTRL